MPPKVKLGYSRGIIACDPSALGLAFTIYIPSLHFSKSMVFNLRDFIKEGKKIKKILNPEKYVPLLVELFDDLKNNEPCISFCDKLIIETQFKENMKLLVMNICTLFLVYYPGIKIEKMSALKCKRAYNISYGDGHYDNKIKMYQYVKNNKKTLIAGDTLIDHNTADSIIILNTWVSLKRRHFFTEPEEYAIAASMDENGFLTFEMKHTWLRCPICKYDTGKIFQIKNGKTPAMNGQTFIKCQNTRCNASSFLGHMRIEPKQTQALDGSKETTIGNKKVGLWALTNGDNKPNNFYEEQAKLKLMGNRIAKSSNSDDEETVNEPPLKRRKLQDSDDPLQNIVESLARDQNELKQNVFDMEKKRKEDFDKLFQAITTMNGPVVETRKKEEEIFAVPDIPANRKVKKSTPHKKTPKRIDVDDLLPELE